MKFAFSSQSFLIGLRKQTFLFVFNEDLILLESQWPVNSPIYYIKKLKPKYLHSSESQEIDSYLGALWNSRDVFILLIPQIVIEFLPYASVMLLFGIERPCHGGIHSRTLNREITIILCYLQRARKQERKQLTLLKAVFLTHCF